MLFIEASLLPGGSHQIILTGQLGNVMQESARAAVSHIRAHAECASGFSPDFLDKHDLHVHVPAGAIPEGRAVGWRDDGDRDPLGGPARAHAEDVAMTGEITLTGLVLPVGGIREKVLAARRPASTRSCCRR